ncbi:sorbosone dehydrogenase family protein [Thalassospira sp.]|uniref:PQQ-dependent sugar dehydrogenase n=1 Tax=Thalassospira sp. TaxID=1912094 RepID=UPI002733986F|nr:PQQ-dependent sugar dehydrogenase [Thalassospira sp.]MDP2700246.1 PQQ-dependent sugar dehydrogenase [Thalassospira sp.]
MSALTPDRHFDDTARPPMIRRAGRFVCAAMLATTLMAVPVAASATDAIPERLQRVMDTLTPASGYRLALFAAVDNARSIAVAPELGGVFIGNRGSNLYFVRDADGDGVAEDVHLISRDFKLANGIAYKPGTLFVADQHRIVSYDLDGFDGTKLGPARILFTNLPDKRHHGWRYAALSPDGGRLFVAVGAPCNICKVSGLEGTIIDIPVTGGAPRIFASGIRNSVGLTFHPDTGALWFTDNGGDNLGDDIPPEELNHAPEAGQFYGYPWYAGGDTRSPQFRDESLPAGVTFPEFTFPAHNAALGLTFYQGDALIALHGSWNRTEPDGYKVERVRFEDGKPVDSTPFLAGFLRENGEVLGRPVDIKPYGDGSILISDDHASAVWRMVPVGEGGN